MSARQPRSADEICADVDRAVIIYGQIEALKKELKAIDERLKADALDRPEAHEPLADPEREGKQFLARGTSYRVPVVITADTLVQSFAVAGDVDARITAAMGDKMSELFRLVRKWETRYEDGAKFRTKCREIFGDQAPEVIAACRALDKDGIVKNSIKLQLDSAIANGNAGTEREVAA